MADASLSVDHVVLRRYCLWLITVSLLVALAGFTAIHEQVAGLYHDDGIYAAVAKSVAEGEGYRIGFPPLLRKQSTPSFTR